jgi:hypothetical protein
MEIAKSAFKICPYSESNSEQASFFMPCSLPLQDAASLERLQPNFFHYRVLATYIFWA